MIKKNKVQTKTKTKRTYKIYKSTMDPGGRIVPDEDHSRGRPFNNGCFHDDLKSPPPFFA